MPAQFEQAHGTVANYQATHKWPAKRDEAPQQSAHLHVADVVAAPQRLKHEVRKAQARQVLDQLLAEVVVDPENLVLFKHLLKVGVELATALKVLAKGLLNYNTRPATPSRALKLVRLK